MKPRIKQDKMRKLRARLAKLRKEAEIVRPYGVPDSVFDAISAIDETLEAEQLANGELAAAEARKKAEALKAAAAEYEAHADGLESSDINITTGEPAKVGVRGLDQE